MTTSPPALPTETSLPPRRSHKLRWFFLLLFTFFALLFAILALLPTWLSSEHWKESILNKVRPMLRSRLLCDSWTLGWTHGVTLRGLEVSNPPGFMGKRALSIGEVHADVSLLPLIRGIVEVEVRILEPEIELEIDPEGRLNLLSLEAERPSRGPDDRGPVVVHTGEAGTPGFFRTKNIQLAFTLRKGRIRIHDRQRGIDSSITNLEIRIGNQAPGDPVRLSIEGRLQEGDEGTAGSFAVTAEAPLLPEFPYALTLRTTGIDLARFDRLVKAFLPETFEVFEGRIEGDLGMRVDRKSGRASLSGNLQVRNLEILGGPLGEGRGLAGSRWSIRPNLVFDPSSRRIEVEGTEIDLGFLKVRAMAKAAARALLARGSAVGNALGLDLELDLAALADQPGLLPPGTWKGRVRPRVAFFLEAGREPGEGPLPFAAEVLGEELAGSGPSLPEGFVMPERFRLAAKGTLEPEAGGRTRGEWSIRAKGLDGKGRFRFEDPIAEGSFDLLVDTEEGAGWIAPLLPEGLKLESRGSLTGTLRSDLSARRSADSGPSKNPRPFRLAEALKGITLDGSLLAPVVSYLGNRLVGFHEKLKIENGRLELKPAGASRLNGAPFDLRLGIEPRPAVEKLRLDLLWRGGKAAYGATPALRYLVPLLAGLPTGDLDRLAGIDFSTTANLELSVEGPLPVPGSVMTSLLSWSGRGVLKLSDGSFTPAAGVASLLKPLGIPGKLAFDRLRSEFRVRDGKLLTEAFEMGGKDGVLTLSGAVSLAGEMDYRIDLTDLLTRHRDGKRILAALGDRRLEARLRGTFGKPEIEVEDFMETVLKGGIENAFRGLLEGLRSGKSPAGALKDLLKGLRKK